MYSFDVKIEIRDKDNTYNRFVLTDTSDYQGGSNIGISVSIILDGSVIYDDLGSYSLPKAGSATYGVGVDGEGKVKNGTYIISCTYKNLDTSSTETVMKTIQLNYERPVVDVYLTVDGVLSKIYGGANIIGNCEVINKYFTHVRPEDPTPLEYTDNYTITNIYSGEHVLNAVYEINYLGVNYRLYDAISGEKRRVAYNLNPPDVINELYDYRKLYEETQSISKKREMKATLDGLDEWRDDFYNAVVVNNTLFAYRALEEIHKTLNGGAAPNVELIPEREFIDIVDISNQLSGKADKVHYHVEADITDLHSRYTDDEAIDAVASAIEGEGNVNVTYDSNLKKISIDDTHNHDTQYVKIGDAVSDSERLNGQTADYYTDADNHSYDNTISGLTSTTTQSAIDEISAVFDNRTEGKIPVIDGLSKLADSSLNNDTTHKTVSYDADRDLNNDNDLYSLVDKKYVAETMTAVAVNYYMTDVDDATGYKIATIDEPTGGEASVVKSDIVDSQYIGGWIAETSALTRIIRGLYVWHIEGEKTSGNKDVRLYWKLFERKTDNTEVELATSTKSDILDGRASYVVPLTLSQDHILDAGSRVVGKIFAEVTGGGGAPTVVMYYNGLTASHWAMPSNPEVLNNIYVPYEGARRDVDLGDNVVMGEDAVIPKLSSDENDGDVPSEDYNWFKGVYTSLVDGSVKSWIMGLVNQMKSLSNDEVIIFTAPENIASVTITQFPDGRPLNIQEGDSFEIISKIDSWANADTDRLQLRINNISDTVYNVGNTLNQSYIKLASGSFFAAMYRPSFVLIGTEVYGEFKTFYNIDGTKWDNAPQIYGVFTNGLNVNTINSIHIFTYTGTNNIPVGTKIIIKIHRKNK